MTIVPERSAELRKQWDGILDSMRPQGAAAPVTAPAAEEAPKRAPAWATPPPAPQPAPKKDEGGLPALVEDQPEPGLHADPFGRYKVKLPEGAVHQKTEDNASWFVMPPATIIIHSYKSEETGASLAARFAAGKKASGAPTAMTVDGKPATITLFTAKNDRGVNTAWVVALYKDAGLLIVVSLPAKDYGAAGDWISGLLRGVKFSGA